MFCPQCGTALAETDRFCRACGAALAGGPIPEGGWSSSPGPEGPVPFRRPGLVTLLAVMHCIGGGTMLLIAAAIAFDVGKEPLPAGIILGVCALLGLLHLSCAVGLLKLRPWSRALQIGLSILGLLAVPLGTLVSILILVYMFRPHIVLLFSGRRPEDLTPAEQQTLRARASGEGAATVVVAVVVGFFVFIAVVGIIAAIAIPNFLSAVERGKQKRTMADMRVVAQAVEAYAVDYNAYPDAGTIDELASILEPAYIGTMPRTDAWGRPFKYEAWLENEEDEAPTLYALGSSGKDGAWERPDLIDTPDGTTTGYGADIVLINGNFVQYPLNTAPAGKRPTAPAPSAPPAEESAGPALRSAYASPSPSSSLYRS